MRSVMYHKFTAAAVRYSKLFLSITTVQSCVTSLLLFVSLSVHSTSKNRKHNTVYCCVYYDNNDHANFQFHRTNKRVPCSANMSSQELAVLISL